MTASPRSTRRIQALLIVGAILAGLCGIPARTGSVYAAGSLYVSPLGSDESDCLSPATACRTIPVALSKAASGDTIDVAAGTYPDGILLRTNVTLIGGGASSTIVGPLTIWDRGVTANVAKLTLTGGARTAGGGIENWGTLTLSESVVRDNTVWAGNGYQAFGGGVFNMGALTLVNSTIRDNQANGWGNDANSGWGGGIHNRGRLTVKESTISGNSAHVGAGIYNVGTMTLTNSTISGNGAKVDGGGITTTDTGVTRLTHVTVAFNASDSDADGTGSGGGIATTGQTEIAASLLAANNAANAQAQDCAGTLSSGGFNLIQDTSGCTITGDTATNRIGEEPRVAQLEDNGGATFTHALDDGSPAIDAASATDCLPTDQRGITRPQGTACDVGAYEAESASTVACPCSLWSEAAVPALIEDPDRMPVELGVKFRSDVDGLVTGIRFYKGSNNTGTHTGTLWSSSGQQLAHATFRNETASGWQEVSFSMPVAIAANTTYIASYHTKVGRYSVDEDYFASSPMHNGPLQALADGAEGSNGVYKYGAHGFPTKTYRASNYWVDIRFLASEE